MFNEGIHVSENKLALGWLKLFICILTWIYTVVEFYFQKQLILEKRKLNSVDAEIEEKSALSGFFSVFFQVTNLLKSVLFCKAFGFYEKHMFQ